MADDEQVEDEMVVTLTMVDDEHVDDEVIVVDDSDDESSQEILMVVVDSDNESNVENEAMEETMMVNRFEKSLDEILDGLASFRRSLVTKDVELDRCAEADKGRPTDAASRFYMRASEEAYELKLHFIPSIPENLQHLCQQHNKQLASQESFLTLDTSFRLLAIV
ncbi:hypothetical protein R1sor_003737 [Riccia sorocarpa]|uniref:Uncharacterized protein n=1 Tax=Riccia sorocarpa TaxID=122646 RepID=A0ABD3H5Y2_9MARC